MQCRNPSRPGHPSSPPRRPRGTLTASPCQASCHSQREAAGACKRGGRHRGTSPSASRYRDSRPLVSEGSVTAAGMAGAKAIARLLVVPRRHWSLQTELGRRQSSHPNSSASVKPPLLSWEPCPGLPAAPKQRAKCETPRRVEMAVVCSLTDGIGCCRAFEVGFDGRSPACRLAGAP